ncbi:MAG: TonB-dependent receptor [Thermoanaerobaculia bacterium]
MRLLKKASLLAAILTLAAASLFAQGLTGTLTGVVSQDGFPLPGVSVSVSSPNLQGTRDTVTNEAGGYNFGALPPGDYIVKFQLEGLQPQTKKVKVALSQAARADAEMQLTAVSEAITVTAAAPAVAETNEVQSNYTSDTIDELPMGRTVTAVTAISPGVVSGVNGLQISGALSSDNLYTVNGAVVQENLRGQPHNLFIEDAIQETTVQTAGVSAEFGNFTGGVVNAITKSGGNEFSGSFRDNITNPSWTNEAPDVYGTNGQLTPTPKNLDETAHQYEATLGGRIIRDRLWFFTSGRYFERDFTANYTNAGGSYARTSKDERIEAKLTAAITPKHNFVVSYLDAPAEFTNGCQGAGCFDDTAIFAAGSNPNDFLTVFYNGVLTNNFLVEAKYSKKDYAFVGYGGTDQDRITGTPIRLFAPGFGGTLTNEAYFCGSCGDELRNNDAIGLKATYYLGSKSLGSHNIVAGVDRWHETRLSNNYQTPSSWAFVASGKAPTRGADGRALVNITPGVDYMQQWPVLVESQGSDLNTDALYFNDKWDLNSRWSFNLGLRFDRNDSADSAGTTVADDSAISPRLGATYDLFANGRVRINATYGQYVGRLAETVSGLGSAAGNPAVFGWLYEGPAIVNATAVDALKTIWAWYDSKGGIEETTLVVANVPGTNRKIDGSLKSPNVDEWTIGASTQIGQGYLRGDIIRREWADYYGVSASTQIGTIKLPNGSTSDLQLISNTNDVAREYTALQLQGQYRLFNRVNIGANYTWSELEGNLNGETSGSGQVTENTFTYYREYYGFAQNNPIGILSTDQTHKIRAWAGIDFATVVGNFNVSVLQNFDSGTPYSLSGSIDVRYSASALPNGVVNPGYATPPTSVGYFFSDRGEYRFDDVTSTDLAINYSTNPTWLRGVGLFAQAEIFNIFDEDGLYAYNTSVLTHLNDSSLKRFNPLAGDVPVEGVHYKKGPNFGRPTSTASYQTPRGYRFSVGLRF